MTKKLEETFNLASPEDMGYAEVEDLDVKEGNVESDVEGAFEEAEAIKDSLAIAKKIDLSLGTIDSLSQHDAEMDEIAMKALQSYEDLCDMTVNMTDNYTARLYEVSATMLKVALDARDSKSNRKMKTLELQLKKMKADSEVGNIEEKGGKETGNQFDRNELLQLLAKREDK